MHTTTLKTISSVLGISVSTVSRALKDHPDIAEKTKIKVRELAESLEYEPNVNAIHLRTNKSRIFALTVPAISNYFYHSFISSVEEESRRRNFSLMVLQSGDDVDSENINLKLCRQNRISGLFAALSPETNNEAAYFKLKELDIPVIFFDKVPTLETCNKVCVADEQSAIIAADALVEAGKKKILAIFGNPKLSITRKRLVSFSSRIAGRAEVEIKYAFDEKEAETITMENQEQPDAIFAMSDEILSGVMKAIQRLSITYPKDIGIIGISNGFIPKLYFPEITYVETSGYKLGKIAFTAMLSCVNKTTSAYIDFTADASLIKGGSL